MTKINVLYASDNNFAPVLGAALLSLFYHNKSNDICAYIISQHITEENKTRLNEIGHQFGKKIVIIEQPNLEEIVGKKIDIQRYSLSMFSRLIADTLLPTDEERIIYLDCDTIVQKDLLPLWEFDLHDKTIGAVDDMRNYRYCRNLGMKKSSHYINSGVLLMDLKRYRDLNWRNRMIDGISKYDSYLEFPDNDLICKLMQDDIQLLPPQFNVISSMYMGGYKKCMKMRRPHLYYSKSEFEEAKSNPVIIHYTTCFAFVGRPWLQGCTHPSKKAFEECYSKTPWANVAFQRPKQHSRDFVRKMYEKLPEFLGVRMIWFLHSWLKPNMQYFTKKRFKRIFRENA